MKTFVGWFVFMSLLAPFVAAVSTSAADPFQPDQDPFGPPQRIAAPPRDDANPFGDPFAVDRAKLFEAAKPVRPQPELKIAPKGSRVDIRKALDSPTTLEFIETPLSDAADFISQRHKIVVEIDTRALTDDGLGSDAPVSVNLHGISLRSGLRIMLRTLGLSFIIRDEALVITTPFVAEVQQVARVYPVADLVRYMEAETGKFLDDYDTLIDLIAVNVRPDTWPEGTGSPPIPGLLGTLIIQQTEEVHEEIAQLLDGLRRMHDQFKQDPTTVATTSLWLATDEVTTRIRKQLQERISIRVEETPLHEFAELLANRLGLPVVLDHGALQDEGISDLNPLTADLRDVPVDLALNRLLHPHRMSWVVRDQVVEITTASAAEAILSTRLYPIYDLVESRSASESPISQSLYLAAGFNVSFQEWWRPPALVMSGTEAIHKRVETMLTELRTAASQAKAQEPLLIQPSRSRMETRLYQLPRDDQDNFTLDAERVAKWIEMRLIAGQFPRMSEPVPRMTAGYVSVLGPGTLLVEHTAATHQAIQSQLNVVGVPAKPVEDAGRGIR